MFLCIVFLIFINIKFVDLPFVGKDTAVHSGAHVPLKTNSWKISSILTILRKENEKKDLKKFCSLLNEKYKKNEKIILFLTVLYFYVEISEIKNYL